MGLVSGTRIISNLIAGSLTGSQLDTLLSTGIHKASFFLAVNNRSQFRSMIASPTAMAAVAASSTAMAAVAASSTAKMAFFNNDIALAAVAASSTAITALRAAAQYAVYTATAGYGVIAIPGPNASGSYILLGVSKNSTDVGQTATMNTRRSGSIVVNSGLVTSGVSSTAATSSPLAIPVSSPFTFTTSVATGCAWYFGMLRCDV